MNILQLCLKPPLPALDGGCIAMNNITTGLLEAGHKVKVLTIFTHKHEFRPSEMPAEYVKQTEIEGVFVDTRINLVDAFSNFVTADSYNISRFFSPDMDIKIAQLLAKRSFDIIHLESLFMTPYVPTIRRLTKAPIVLRSHNLEFEIWEKIARGTRNFAKRTYLKYLSNRLRDYELSALNSVSGIAAISGQDMARFRELGITRPMTDIPFGLDVSAYTPTSPPGEISLFHLGAMDWSPNLEAIVWFLSDVWPRIHAAHPQLKLYLAGRNMPPDISEDHHPNVVFLGEVDDARAFMSSHSIMIVPLLSGGGIRVKIIEGMALAKAIVSTSIGAEGIDCKNGRDILIADSPAEWARTIDRLLKSPALIHDLGKNARHLAETHFDNQQITARLIAFYKSLRKK